MVPRITTTGLLGLLLVFWPASLKAQQASDAASTKQLTSAVAQLSQQVTQLSTQMQQMQKELAEWKDARPVAEHSDAAPGNAAPAATSAGNNGARAELEALRAKVHANTDLIDSIDGRLADMAEDAREFVAQVQQQNVVQQQMLAAISTTGATGNAIPNLRAVMSDSRGREALDEAVHQVLRRSGTVIIENQMGQNYTMRVNGQTHVVPAGGAVTVQEVPVGHVTTELLGYEEPKVLALAPPNYELKVLIRPEQRQTVQRVAAPAVYEYGYRYDPLWGWVVVR